MKPIDILNDFSSNFFIEGRSGSGKTSLVVDKYLHLVKGKLCSASEILVLTSSSSYSSKLQDRILRGLSQSFDDSWVLSFNVFILKLFKENSFNAGYKYESRFLTRYESLLIIKELISSNLQSLGVIFNDHYTKNSFLKSVQEFFEWIKINRLDIKEIQSIIFELYQNDNHLRSLFLLYEKYQHFLFENNLVDKNDLTNLLYNLLHSNPQIVKKIQEQFKYVLVDHYEECNIAFSRVFNLLFRDFSGSVSIFADKHQIVDANNYGTFAGISQNTVDALNLKDVRLTESLRSSERLNKIASAWIENSIDYSEIDLNVYECEDVQQEINYLASKINYLKINDKEFDYEKVAVVSNSLYNCTKALEDTFVSADIPFKSPQNINFLHHKSVTLFLSLISFIIDGKESTLKQLLPLYIGEESINITDYMSFEYRTGHNILRDILYRNLSPVLEAEDRALIEKLKELYFGIKRLRFKSTDDVSLYEWVGSIYNSYMAEYLRINEDAVQIENLKIFLSMIRTIDSICSMFDKDIDIHEFFKNIEGIASLYVEMNGASSDLEQNGVSVISMNQLKDNEYDYVFLVNMSESFFPRFDNRNITKQDPVMLLYDAFCSKGYNNITSPLIDNDHTLSIEENKLYMSLAKANKDLFITYSNQINDKEESMSSLVRDLIGKDEVKSCLLDGDVTYPNNSKLELDLEMNYNLLSSDLKNELDKYRKELHFDKDISKSDLSDRAVHISTRKRFSATAINTYLSCPKKFFFNKVLSLTPPLKDIMHVGNEVHKVLEILHRVYPVISKVDMKELKVVADRLIERVWHGFESSRDLKETVKERRSTRGTINNFTSKAVQNFYYNQLVQMVHRYIKQEPISSYARSTKFTEKRLSFSVKGINLYGIIDRIDIDDKNNYHVIDYKTTKSDSAFKPETEKSKYLNVKQKDDYKPKNFQMPIYYLACREALGVTPKSIEYYYLNQPDAQGMFKKMKIAFEGEEKGRVAVIESEQLDEVLNNLSDTVDSIREGKFPAEPVDKMTCQNCDYRIVCKEAVI